jgi:hypothetical protein
MNDTATVDRTPGSGLQVVSTKYPADRVHLLEAVQKRRGDKFVSETVRVALDELIERHFPGATVRPEPAPTEGV